MTNKLPVVFIHFGDAPPYAQTVIARARSFGNEVVFLNPSLDELHAHPFAQVYEHMSTNHFDFELACIVRWFWLRDWMGANDCPVVMYCDTDVLLYVDAEGEWNGDLYYAECDFTLSLGTSGHTSYWRLEALEMFCKFLTEIYTARDETFEEMQRIYAEMQAQNLAGGLNDMTFLKWFAARQGWRNVGEMSRVRDGMTFDHNFSTGEGFSNLNFELGNCFAMEPTHKRIIMDGGLPYGFQKENGAPVLFKSLHFQGSAKEWIPQYAYDPARMPQ